MIDPCSCQHVQGPVGPHQNIHRRCLKNLVGEAVGVALVHRVEPSDPSSDVVGEEVAVAVRRWEVAAGGIERAADDRRADQEPPGTRPGRGGGGVVIGEKGTGDAGRDTTGSLGPGPTVVRAGRAEVDLLPGCAPRRR